jgi:hypothetical protein
MLTLRTVRFSNAQDVRILPDLIESFLWLVDDILDRLF